MKFEVRQATRADAAQITDVQVASWRAGYAHIFAPEALSAPEFDSSRREFWAAWRLTPGERVMVGVDTSGESDRIAAFCSFGLERDRGTIRRGRGEIYAFYAHPDDWGTGIADELMHAVDSRLRSDGFGVAVLWVLDDNPRARRFYERHGWAPTGIVDRFNAYGSSVREVEYHKEFIHADRQH
jgi:RimJ/RimL family protein N-acetyltransferase